MTPKSFLLNDDLHAYLLASSTQLDDVARSLIDETAGIGDISRMQVAPEQGLLLTLLTRVVGARRAVEGGHVHRIVRPLHRPGPGQRWALDVLRHQRGVDRRARGH